MELRKLGFFATKTNFTIRHKGPFVNYGHIFKAQPSASSDSGSSSSQPGNFNFQLMVDADLCYVYDELIASFPKLRVCRGFERLRTHDRSKLLIDIE